MNKDICYIKTTHTEQQISVIAWPAGVETFGSHGALFVILLRGTASVL